MKSGGRTGSRTSETVAESSRSRVSGVSQIGLPKLRLSGCSADGKRPLKKKTAHLTVQASHRGGPLDARKRAQHFKTNLVSTRLDPGDLPILRPQCPKLSFGFGTYLNPE